MEHEFFCLGRLGSKEIKVDLSFSDQLLRVIFSNILWAKNFFLKYCSDCTKKLHKIKLDAEWVCTGLTSIGSKVMTKMQIYFSGLS